VGEEAGEVDLAFIVNLPTDETQAFREFCRLAPFFDGVVASLAYVPQHSLWSWESLQSVVAKSSLCALIWTVHNYTATEFVHPAVQATTAGLLGILAMDLLMALQSKRSRRLTEITGMTWGRRARILPFPTYGRFLDQLWDLTVGTVFVSGHYVLRSLPNPLVLIAIGVGIYLKVDSVWFWGLLGAAMYIAGDIYNRSLSKKSQAWT
jgi:hypothetical protein